MAVRTYELGFIIDPRESEEDAVALTDGYKEMLVKAGVTIDKEESWGKRRLAYPINKLNEGRYVFLYLSVEKPISFSEIEKRLNQNEKILRYLTVRTDPDLKRQASKGKQQPEPAETAGKE